MNSESSRRIPPAVMLLVGLGTVLRLNEYFQNRPLWIDEAMIALNIGRHGPFGPVSPLRFDQSAPPLFILSSRLVVAVAGMGESALRFLPLLAGVALPLLVWLGGRRLAGEVPAAMAAALTAVSVPLITYSAELKPYELDAAVTAVLVLLAARVCEAPRDRRWWWALAAGIVPGLLLSTPSLFVVVAVVAVLSAEAAARRDREALRRAGVLALSCGLFAVLLVVLVYGPQSRNLYLQRFWDGTFLVPGALDLRDRVFWLVRALGAPFPDPAAVLRARWLLVALALAAVAALRLGGRGVAAILLLPAVAAAGASTMGRYAIHPRLFLFQAPLGFLLIGLLLAWVLRRARIPERQLLSAGVLAVLLWGTPGVIRNGRAPRLIEEGRAGARLVRESAGREPVYVFAAGLPAWLYFTMDWSRPDRQAIDRIADLAEGTGPAAHNSLLPERPGAALPGPGVTALLGRRVLIGARTGVSSREPVGWLRTRPDSGWAHREVDRIEAAAHPYLWVYGAHLLDSELLALRSELSHRGFVTVTELQETGALAMRVRHPSASSRVLP